MTTAPVQTIHKPHIFLFCSVLLFAVACSEDDPVGPADPTDPEDDVVYTAGIGEARDISSFDLVGEMGVGWNLGNSFDVRSVDKTAWGNPLPNREMIDGVRAMGFRTLRIPITWVFHQSGEAPYTIDTDYLREVRKVVNYGFQNKMHVIINVHHDDYSWLEPSASAAAEAEDRLASLWTQVANYFIEYNDSLIFETMNEPRLVGSAEEWTGGTSAGRGYVNDFHQAAVDAIRATGGNNAKRHLMIPTWAASTVPAAMDDLVIPNNDPKVIISLHTYFPWQFAGEASIEWGSDQDKADLQAEFDRIRQKWVVEEQRPVILGEWGTIRDNSIDSRVEYASFYASEAASRELLTIVWDDGGMFGLFNRTLYDWDFEEIAEAIINAQVN